MMTVIRVVVAVVLVLALSSAPADATVWETTYFTRGAGGVPAPNWCTNGHYVLLKNQNNTTV